MEILASRPWRLVLFRVCVCAGDSTGKYAGVLDCFVKTARNDGLLVRTAAERLVEWLCDVVLHQSALHVHIFVRCCRAGLLQRLHAKLCPPGQLECGHVLDARAGELDTRVQCCLLRCWLTSMPLVNTS